MIFRGRWTGLGPAGGMVLLGVCACAGAEEAVLELLWPDGAPGALGTATKDKPALFVHQAPADKATGAAIVVCPGGGYGHLAMGHEGQEIAQWLNGHGITAFILRYRHSPDYLYPAPMDDGHRAIRTVRARAADWNVDPKRIGMMGFSAGGHLASTIGTHFTRGKPLSRDPIQRASSRPDFLILVYPVVSLTEPHSHRGSCRNLLGPKPDPKLKARLSNETQVTKKTPPTFLVHTTADRSVSSINSALFYEALKKAGVPAELHIFEQGKHGFGLSREDPVLSVWPDLCMQWLRTRGLLETP